MLRWRFQRVDPSLRAYLNCLGGKAVDAADAACRSRFQRHSGLYLASMRCLGPIHAPSGTANANSDPVGWESLADPFRSPNDENR